MGNEYSTVADLKKFRKPKQNKAKQQKKNNNKHGVGQYTELNPLSLRVAFVVDSIVTCATRLCLVRSLHHSRCHFVCEIVCFQG